MPNACVAANYALTLVTLHGTVDRRMVARRQVLPGRPIPSCSFIRHIRTPSFGAPTLRRRPSMRIRGSILAILAALTLFTLPSRTNAVPQPPPSFAVDDAVPGAGFVTPVGIAFLPDGRFFVAEKQGRVFEVRNGVKRTT